MVIRHGHHDEKAKPDGDENQGVAEQETEFAWTVHFRVRLIISGREEKLVNLDRVDELESTAKKTVENKAPACNKSANFQEITAKTKTSRIAHMADASGTGEDCQNVKTLVSLGNRHCMHGVERKGRLEESEHNK